jgi:hypothetical protein
MIFSLYFHLDGICRPSGLISEDRSEVVAFARDIAQSGVGLLDDWVTDADWLDADGSPSDARSILDALDENDLLNAISQVSDAMQSRRVGFIQFNEHDDLFALLDHHHAVEWLPQHLRDHVDELRRAYRALTQDLSDEWNGL